MSSPTSTSPTTSWPQSSCEHARGDVGAVKLYVGDLAEGAFLSHTFVFLVGALAAFIVVAFLRRG